MSLASPLHRDDPIPSIFNSEAPNFEVNDEPSSIAFTIEEEHQGVGDQRIYRTWEEIPQEYAEALYNNHDNDLSAINRDLDNGLVTLAVLKLNLDNFNRAIAMVQEEASV